MDRESSRGRNVRFSARHVADRINLLMELKNGAETDEHLTEKQLHLQYESLVSQRNEAEAQGQIRLPWPDLAGRRWRLLAFSAHTELEDRVRQASILARAAPPDVVAWLDSRSAKVRRASRVARSHH